MKTSIWIDLEETVIESWYNRIPLSNNIRKICKWVDANADQPQPRINIFSYAIHNEEDFDYFWNNIEPILSYEFPNHYTINKTITVQFLLKNQMFHSTTTFEYMQFVSKYNAFFNYVLNLNCFDTKFVLFDDCVPNTKIEFKDTGNIIETININNGL